LQCTAGAVALISRVMIITGAKMKHWSTGHDDPAPGVPDVDRTPPVLRNHSK